ncbi:MAG: TlpA family protein disulfide reductase [Rhodoferax sp.]|nr:TlpA family protein disulfide reductase [Rhodoferax sp.]
MLKIVRHGGHGKPTGAAGRAENRHTAAMMLRRSILAWALCLPVAARAGILDWLNGGTVGKPLPTHDLKFLGAAPDPLARLQLVDFWATWCAPCRESIPKLNTFHHKYAARGLAIIGVTQEKQEVVERFMKMVPFHYPVAIDLDGKLHENLRIFGLPYALFIDKNHTIVWRGAPSAINDGLIEWLLKDAGPLA